MSESVERVAALYDIHGNLPALEAVLTEVRNAGVDRILVGGDVLPGPMPCETLDLLSGLEIPTGFIYGNGERAVLAALHGDPLESLAESVRHVIDWCGNELTEEQLQWVSTWPPTAELQVRGLGPTMFCHATPRDENEVFTVRTPAEVLQPLFTAHAGMTVVCGHTHMQFDRRIGGTRVVNAGSVGMPFGEPGAHWLLLGPSVQLNRTRYDLENAAERIAELDYPEAAAFASTNVLNPPSEESMLAAFGRSALG